MWQRKEGGLITINVFELKGLPNKRVDVKREFALNVNAFVPAFSSCTQFVSKLLPGFQFDKQITLCVLTGLIYNKRVLISGAYGAGKSSHIEQACSRLNWPSIRINMDSWITRLELIGKDTITTKNGVYAVKFKYGIIPWATKRGISLILDDYDACKPETKFVLNKLLESNGEISVPENNKIITPHASFRVFATCNNIRSSNYSGTYKSNLAQLDRWNIVALMGYPSKLTELKLLSKKINGFLINSKALAKIVKLAEKLRHLYSQRVIKTLLSTRSVISWVELSVILNNINKAFKITFLNKCVVGEQKTIIKCYNQIFGSRC